MSVQSLSLHGIKFHFVPYGTVAPPNLEGSNCLYLDVGGDRRVGVLDHHKYKIFQCSATQMVERNPELIRKAIDRSKGSKLNIFVHHNPDLDAVASVALALEILDKDPDDAAKRLADYINLVDSGRKGAIRENPFSLYSAYAQVIHNLSELEEPNQVTNNDNNGNGLVERWKEVMTKGIQLVQYVLRESRNNDLPIELVDAFSCPLCLSRRDRVYIEADPDRYRAKLSNPDNMARIVRMQLPLPLGGYKQLNGLMIRNVQGFRVPDRVMFFKDWARSDHERNPSEGGFPLLCVYEEKALNNNAMCWISLRPDDGAVLTGLGNLLEEAELEERFIRFGEDLRWIDKNTGEKLPPRTGFDNPDPWYDGYGHDYRIIQTPNDGTVLSADQVEAILLNYGSGIEVKNLVDMIPDPWTLIISDSDNVDMKNMREHKLLVQVRMLDLCYRSALDQADLAQIEKMDIFISYPRVRLDWVNKNLLKPIQDIFGKERVFLDTQALQAGASWIRGLGLSIQTAKVFIPVLCPEYESSPWCQWEYEIAYISHTSSMKPEIMPICLDHSELPVYLRIQHAESIWQDGWLERFLGRLSACL
jgi:hypothetical protein